MNPTNEQLDAWSAEALGCITRNVMDGKGWLRNGVLFYLKANWHPSTNLSQAWREFVPVLYGKRMLVALAKGFDEENKIEKDAATIVTDNGDGRAWDTDGIGETVDQKAAYALTYGFVQAMESKSYLEWKAKNES